MTSEPRPSDAQGPESTFPGAKQAGPPGASAAHRGDEDLARVWGIAACDLCGRTILLGENAVHLTSGGPAVQVCAACAADRGAAVDRRAA